MARKTRKTGKPRRVTQKSIADSLGFSQTLVSLALNGNKAEMSENTYETIWSTARELGYSPTGMQTAFAMPQEGGKKVGILLRRGVSIDLYSNFFSSVHNGIHKALVDIHARTLFLGAEDDTEPQVLLDAMPGAQELTGLIILGEIKASLLSSIMKIHSNVVAVSADYAGFCTTVSADEKKSATLAVDYLYDCGHRKIGWIGGDVRLSRHNVRQHFVIDALRTKELCLPEYYCTYAQESASEKEGYQNAERLLKNLSKEKLPTALICHNSNMARGVLQFFMFNNIRVPDDISIIALDTTSGTNHEWIELTSAGADPAEIGREAVRIIWENAAKNDEPEVQTLTIESKLHLGKTVAKI